MTEKTITPEDERAFRRLIKHYTRSRDWNMVRALLTELGFRWQASEGGSAQWSAVLILSMFAAFLFALTTVTR